jgi:ABC-type multidrug transport system ATPase subunit/CRP-like cAMP-binding protein
VTALKPVAVGAGSTVVREGEPGEQFFLIEHGTLAVVRERHGEPHLLSRLGPGEYFGEMALLADGGRRTATVRAETAARLWSLSAGDFRELLAREPRARAVLRRAARLRATLGALEVEQRNLAALAQGRQRLSLGRHSDNDLVFPSRVVSRHHAVLERSGDAYRLRDLGSANGTYVNGVAIRAADLQDGDEVWIGDQRLIFDRREGRRRVAARGIRIDVADVSQVLKGGKHLLCDISLAVLPSEFVAIVGGSGAGKTTLLDAMSGVRPATSGAVRYNGHDYYRDLPLFRTVLGYVPQDDIIHTGLPVRRTLQYAAKLRLPPDTSPQDLDGAVDQTLEALGLTAHAGTRVGKLSGGQRKRSSIGVELLTRPQVFFLDEPTSGLDPATEAQMMRLLRRLADEGSTVILTTHATKNVMLCDKVVFLTRGGYLAFAGSPRRALEYFQADTFDQIYERLADEATPEVWAERFRASADYAQALAQPPPPDGAAAGASASVSRTATDGPKTPQPDGAAAGASTAPRQTLAAGRRSLGPGRQVRQLAVLGRRNVDILARNPSLLVPLLAQPLAITLLLLLLFRAGAFSADAANPGVASLILFFLSFGAFFFGISYGTPEICKEYAIFRRERMVNLAIVPYVFSKLVVLGPILVAAQIVMLLALRLSGRLPDRGLDVYGPLLLTQVLTTFAGLTFSLFISALLSSPDQANQLQPALIMPQTLFSGAIVSVPTMGIIGKAVSTLMIGRWSFEALGRILDLNGLWASSASPIGRALLLQYEDSFSRDPVQNWWIIGGFAVASLVLACLVLKRKGAAA